MIKAKKGTVRLKGMGADVLAELSTVVHSVMTSLCEAGVNRDMAETAVLTAVMMGLKKQKEGSE